jgi:6-phosphofructo-2-kinase/fructose-2,6-biphosphatase
MGYSAKVFSVGSYRRQLSSSPLTSSFFDPSNESGNQIRQEAAVLALEELMKFLTSGGHVAIYDATNSTNERRSFISSVLHAKSTESGVKCQLVWVEVICNDPAIVERNIRETKLTSPDYRDRTEIDAIQDLFERIKMYELNYESIPQDSSHSYIKLIDSGKQVQTNRISGYLCGKLTFFLMNLRPWRAPIYISRHGESLYNTKGLIGGDSELSEAGHQYARALAEFIANEEEFKGGNAKDLTVWTSTLKRTIQTASYLRFPSTEWRALVEIQVGICDHMTYEEIEQKFPDEYKARKKDKLRYRYPQGESYLDVVQRLEPVIFELERMQTPVLLIVHRGKYQTFE